MSESPSLSLTVTEAQEDYGALLSEIGMTDAQVWEDMAAGGASVPFPPGVSVNLAVKPSPIHGKGVFTSSPIKFNESVGVARFSGIRTPLGRYVNHSANPNSEMRTLPNGDLGTVALRDIEAGEEITNDYRNALALAMVSEHSIDVVEQYLLSTPQVDVDTRHALAGEVYARTIHVPAGVVMVGARHLHDHINIFVGDVSFRTDQGMKRLTGFNVLPTKGGMKRVGYFHTPTSWTTVSHTKLTDLAEIEEEMTDEAHKLQTRTLNQEQTLCLPQSQPA